MTDEKYIEVRLHITGGSCIDCSFEMICDDLRDNNCGTFPQPGFCPFKGDDVKVMIEKEGAGRGTYIPSLAEIDAKALELGWLYASASRQNGNIFVIYKTSDGQPLAIIDLFKGSVPHLYVGRNDSELARSIAWQLLRDEEKRVDSG